MKIGKIGVWLCALLIALGIAPAAVADVPPPDYAQPQYWSKIDSAPKGLSARTATLPVDVFWVHPTTTRSSTDLNHDPLEAEALTWTEQSAVQRQASAFSACCRIFAPRYRAATSKALMDPANRPAAFALAYSDVQRAFDWYMAHENKGRPFILAGHSQGGAHVASLLEARIKGAKLQGKLVAAYIIGINLMDGDLSPRFAGIDLCIKPNQTGCLLQWNAMLAGTDTAPTIAAYAKAFADLNGGRSGGSPLCINPVTFDASRPLSLSAQAKGAVAGDPGLGSMQALRAGVVAAECRNGLLTVWPASGLGLQPLSNGSMHYHDVGLFWADISANAMLRAKAWLRVHGSAR